MTHRDLDATPVNVPELAREVRRQQAAQPSGRSRLMIGLCGPPGAGKTTTADALVDHLGGPPDVVAISLDGFHLASDLLDADQARRRGAPNTFDGGSFAALLERLRANAESIVYAPTFSRDIEEPIGSAVAVPRSSRVILVEGNYLLAEGPDWLRARSCLDQVWYLETPDSRRIQWLIDRHVEFGKVPDAAEEWVHRSDEHNTNLVKATRHRANRVYRIVES